MPNGNSSPSRVSFSLGGLVLVVLGLVFLLQSLGVLPWGLWGTLWRFWPIILLLVGINLLLGSRSPWLTLGISCVVLLGVVGAAVLINRSRPAEVTSPFSQPLQGVERAEVVVEFGAGELVIDSLPPGSANLSEGRSNLEVRQDFRIQGSAGILHVSLPGKRVVWPFEEGRLQLDVSLNPDIPVELTVKTGASDARLDLTNLKLTRLQVEAGASRVNLQLPARAGTTRALVKAGAAQVNITIPQGVAARITADTGLASFSVDTSRFPRVGERYESPDFATAANRVDLQVEGGVASVDIR